MIDQLIDWLIYSDHACAGVRREKFMHQSVPGCSSCGGRCGGGRRCSMSSLTTSQETHSSPGRKSSRTSTHWWGGAEREGEERGEVYRHSDNEFPLAQVDTWTELSVQIFSRHEDGNATHREDGEGPTHKAEGEAPAHSREQEMMRSLNANIRSCLSHYTTRLSGENGG